MYPIPCQSVQKPRGLPNAEGCPAEAPPLLLLVMLFFWGVVTVARATRTAGFLSGGFEKVCACAIIALASTHPQLFSHRLAIYLDLSQTYSTLCIFSFFLLLLMQTLLKLQPPLPYLTPWGQNASIVASLGPFRSSPRVFLSHSVQWSTLPTLLTAYAASTQQFS